MYEEQQTEQLIMDAIKNDWVEVYYQPIYSIKEQKFTCAEALIRIRNGMGKIISPGAFVDVAESNGMIIRLGEKVFEKVCCFLQEHHPEELGLHYIEVNLSVVQCDYEHLAESFIRIMEAHQINPEWINLEITESASGDRKKNFTDNMKNLMDYGITFSLDDFGTGQSNLNYIVEMPVDIVKFDRSMTAAYFANGKAKYVMDAAMHMIQGLKLQIVSEGIETRKQFETMRDLGINYIQGYYFSEPLPMGAFLQFLDRKNK
jgi:EAL domain-containing protein (putative c-di-GMP-specific phosphodiesterase class I)